MIVDLEKDSPSEQRADVCVIGAGAAGITLAMELAHKGCTVTLLESGGIKPERETQALYNSAVIGHRHNGTHTGRYRVFGGTTTQWGGQILELDAHDFEKRSWIPGSGWPFEKSTLAPFYRRAIELEGLSSSIMDDASVWRALRLSPPPLGKSLVPFFSRWCPQPDFTRVFGERLTCNPRISIWLHANACQILLNRNRDGIAGVRCRTLSGREFTFVAGTYVLCLGGIETARLLLQPSADDNRIPWQESGLVGRFFQDHIDSTLIKVVPRDRRRLHRIFDNVYRRGFKYHPKLKLSAAEQRARQCLSIGATFEFRSKKHESLSEFRNVAQKLLRGTLRPTDAATFLRRLPDAGLLAKQAIRYKLRGRAFNPDDDGIFLRVHCEQSPNGRSRICLGDERDGLGMLRASVDWRVSDLEIQTIRHFVSAVRSSFENGFGEVKPFPDLDKGGEALLARFDDSNHHMGATRMSVSANTGVVDPDLRLFGIRNGFVCSSSVFPTSGFSNPTHTLIALAARLAEHLAAQIPRMAS